MTANTKVLFVLFGLVALAITTLVVVAIVQLKTRRKQQARIQQYLSSSQVGLAQAEQQALFKSELQAAGLKGKFQRFAIRATDVADLPLVVSFFSMSATSFGLVFTLGTDWPGLIQFVTLMLVNFVLLSFLYQWKVKQLAEQFEQDFPHAIATLSRSISAGLSLNAGLVQAQQQSQGRVKQVLTEVTDLLAIGATLEQALAQAGIKVQQPSFKFFTVCLLLNQQSGGQLGQVLHQLMTNIHERKTHDKKVLAMTAEPRMSAKIIALLPPLFLWFCYYQMPESFEYLRHNPAGQMVSAYAFISIVAGLWIINRMTKVD